MADQIPLADKLRPKTIDKIIGQEHLLGKGKLLSTLIEKYETTRFVPSLIFWGPPGCGKTTAARALAQTFNRQFHEFSAVNASVKDIVKIIPKKPPKGSLELIKETTPIVFIDEIHRFNKAQQDALLPLVEQGEIIFFGATTENPSFEVIGPLLSRTRVLVFEALSEDALQQIVTRAGNELNISLSPDAMKYLVKSSNGDARICINVLEIAARLADSNILESEDLKRALQKSNLYFDLQGEEFYNTISALHKSIRGSDPDASLYWLARMLEAGQDPLYIARRLIRVASEDIGLADPNALSLAINCFNACNMVGMPECNLTLAETVVYLAKSSKNNSIYIAYGKAVEDVKTHGNLPVPLHIRNAPTQLMKDLGYGKGYDYTHSPEGKKNDNIDYFPDKLKNRKYFK